MASRTKTAKKNKSLHVELRKIWFANKFEDAPPFGLKDLVRELAGRLGVVQTHGRKMSACVVAHWENKPLDPHVFRGQRSKKHEAPNTQSKSEFYSSWEWRTLRMKVLKEYGPKCMCCGATPDHKDMSGNPVRIVVDHIKPLHTHWGLRLSRANLQVLCDECNQGKGAWDTTDHRPKDGPDEWIIEDDGIPDILKDKLRTLN